MCVCCGVKSHQSQRAACHLLLSLSRTSKCLAAQVVDVLLDAVADVAERLRHAAADDGDGGGAGGGFPAACQLENVGYVLDCAEHVLAGADSVLAANGGLSAASGVLAADGGVSAASGVSAANGGVSAASGVLAANGGVSAASGVSAADGGAAQLRRRLSSQLDLCLRHVAATFPLFAYRVWQLAALLDARQRRSTVDENAPPAH